MTAEIVRFRNHPPYQNKNWHQKHSFLPAFAEYKSPDSNTESSCTPITAPGVRCFRQACQKNSKVTLDLPSAALDCSTLQSRQMRPYQRPPGCLSSLVQLHSSLALKSTSLIVIRAPVYRGRTWLAAKFPLGCRRGPSACSRNNDER